MPLFTYLAIAGSLLLGLLFAADAVLPPTAPAYPTSSFYGLPPAWKSDASAPLVASPAPEPDMSSAAVLAAAPPAAPAAKATADAAMAQGKPVKRKHVARRPQQDNRQGYYDYRTAANRSLVLAEQPVLAAQPEPLRVAPRAVLDALTDHHRRAVHPALAFSRCGPMMRRMRAQDILFAVLGLVLIALMTFHAGVIVLALLGAFACGSIYMFAGMLPAPDKSFGERIFISVFLAIVLASLVLLLPGTLGPLAQRHDVQKAALAIAGSLPLCAICFELIRTPRVIRVIRRCLGYR